MNRNYDFEYNYWQLLVKLITTFDKSPEANVDDYSTDMGALRHLVDRMLNKKETFDCALQGARFYNKTLQVNPPWEQLRLLPDSLLPQKYLIKSS